MRMSTTAKMEAEFKKECYVIRMSKEYPGYRDKIKCVILSELSEDEIKAKYGELLKNCSPYLVTTIAIQEVVKEYRWNDAKYYQREHDYVDFALSSEDMDRYFFELMAPSAEDDFVVFQEREEIQRRVRITLSKLPEQQKRLLVKRYFQEKTLKRIGKEEGFTERTTSNAVRVAKREFAEIWKKETRQTVYVRMKKEEACNGNEQPARGNKEAEG